MTWSTPFENSGVHKPGQFNAGSGTTPRITNDGWVAITDKAEHMNVVVYRRAATLSSGSPASCARRRSSPGRG